MAKNVAVKPFLDELNTAIASVARSLNPGQINIMLTSNNLWFKWTGEMLQAYHDAELTPAERSKLDSAIAKLAELDAECKAEVGAANTNFYMSIGAKLAEVAEDERGSATFEFQAEHARTVSNIELGYTNKRLEHERERDTLQAKQGDAGVSKLKELAKYKDPPPPEVKSTMPLAGNVLICRDLGVTDYNGYKMHGMISPNGEFYVWPYGADIGKNGPKLKREEWISLGTPGVTSPTQLQQITWMAINRYGERKDRAEFAKYLAGVVANNNLQKNVGGSRNVQHVREKPTEGKGYTRQVKLAEIVEKFGKLPFKFADTFGDGFAPEESED